MDEQIKPVAFVIFTGRKKPDVEWMAGEVERGERLYSQQSIDTLRAEVAEWKRVASAQAEFHCEAEARAERAEAELEALRWVVEQYVTLQTDGGGRWRVEFGYTSPVTYGPWADSRMAAIDAARKGAE